MTVLGCGIDVVNIESFTAQIGDEASGFAQATFTTGELRAARAVPEMFIQRLAARFAAKEALIKAWAGARTGRTPLLGELPNGHEMEVVNDGWGRPLLRAHGAVAAGLAALADELNLSRPPQIHLSLTHDPPCAAAMVVLSGTIAERAQGR